MTPSPPTLSSRDAADLADALARGRLCITEVADIRPGELNALFEVAARRLELGAAADAVELMAALVMLFPYSAKSWRGYGVCLHRHGAFDQAAAAYRAAVLLAPEHGMTQCYLGEVLVQLGDGAGVSHIMVASQSSDEAARARASLLLRALEPGNTPLMPAAANSPAALGSEPTDPLFSAADGRPLPLQDGRYSLAEAQYLRPSAPEPVTDRLFIAAGDKGLPENTGTGTDTALVPRGPPPARLRDHSGASATARVDRRPQRPPVLPTAWRKRKDGIPLTDEITLTDLGGDP